MASEGTVGRRGSAGFHRISGGKLTRRAAPVKPKKRGSTGAQSKGKSPAVCPLQCPGGPTAAGGLVLERRATTSGLATNAMQPINSINSMNATSLKTAAITIAMVLVMSAPWAAPLRVERGKPQTRARAHQPTVWDKATEAVFFDDAFTTLEGDRPDFAAATVGPAAMAAPAATATQSAAGTAGGFKWSRLVSPDTLADEIKDNNTRLAAAVASASDFKGGGYDEARIGFSAIALAFAVIAEYDGDVRWRKDAEQVRDLFARVAANCKVGTAQSFAEAKARVDDLAALVEGSGVEAKADREGDFAWSQVAGRPALMGRLESADGVTAAATASKEEFSKQVEKFLHDVEMVAVIGEVIQRPAYEYHDDDTYRAHAASMRDAAIRAREAALKDDYDAARTAVGTLKKTCDACHGDYRG